MAKKQAEQEPAVVIKRPGGMYTRVLKRYDEADTCPESILLVFRAVRRSAEDLKGGLLSG